MLFCAVTDMFMCAQVCIWCRGLCFRHPVSWFDEGRQLSPDCALRSLTRLPKLATLEFDRNRKSMSVIVKGPAGNQLLVKGAAECVLERCTSIMLSGGVVKPLLPAVRASLMAAVDRMAEEALRCLVLAQKVTL